MAITRDRFGITNSEEMEEIMEGHREKLKDLSDTLEARKTSKPPLKRYTTQDYFCSVHAGEFDGDFYMADDVDNKLAKAKSDHDKAMGEQDEFYKNALATKQLIIDDLLRMLRQCPTHYNETDRERLAMIYKYRT